VSKIKNLFVTLGIVIILINALHSFWYLNFTSLIWLVIFKFALFIFCAIEFLKEKPRFKFPIIDFRLILLVSFVLLLGIPKINFGIQPFSGKYELIEICTAVNSSGSEASLGNRIERSEMNYGLSDSKEKTEVVYPLFLMFEWRFEIDEITKYKSEYIDCKFLRIGEPY